MGRSRSCCHTFLAFILKFLNFLQSFLGVCTTVYSVFMLNQWDHRIPLPPPPVAPSPSDWGAVEIVSGVDDDGVFSYNSNNLPAPWFIYSFMLLGVVLCSVNCVGLIAAESIDGCCLCFALSLLLAFVLRATVSTRMDDEYDNNYDIESTREPLFHMAWVLATADNKYDQVNRMSQ